MYFHIKKIQNKMKLFKLLLLSAFIIIAKTSFSCDDANISLNSQTDNLDGTYTYEFNLCVEMLGLEGIPEWFQIEFLGNTYTSIVSFTPPIISTSSGDDFTGSIIGDAVRYTFPGVFPAHNANLMCATITITTNGEPGSLNINYHDTYGPSCEETIVFPFPCSISGITAGVQTPCVLATNSYTQEVTVTYSSAPASGTIDINGQSFPITNSPQTVTLTNLPSDGNPVEVTAAFSADLGCTLTENSLFTAPADCSTPCTPDNGTWD